MGKLHTEAFCPLRASREWCQRLAGHPGADFASRLLQGQRGVDLFVGVSPGSIDGESTARAPGRARSPTTKPGPTDTVSA